MRKSLHTMLIALVAMMMPLGMWAQEATAQAQWGTSKESITGSGTLAEAFAAVVKVENNTKVPSDIRYIQLLNDIETETMYQPYTGNFTLDLNGHTLTSSNTYAIYFTYGTVTITDESANQTGKIILDNASNESAILYVSPFQTKGEMSLTIEGGTYEGGGCAVQTNATTSYITFNGGAFCNQTKATVHYAFGKLDFSGHSNPSNISIYNYSGNFWNNDDYIKLPNGYVIFDSNDNIISGYLTNGNTYTLGIANLAITDNGTITTFSQTDNAKVGTLTYTRTLPNNEWNALFVPFEIPVSQLSSNYDVAYFNNMHAYDRNNDGAIDKMDMEVIFIKEGTLRANHPYFIRAKSEGAMAMTLNLNNVTLHNTAVENRTSITTSSAYLEFTLAGVYEQKAGAEGVYAINTGGAWSPIAEDAKLNPFRLYLQMTTRNGSPVKVDPQAAQAIRIRAKGEGTTSIDNGQLTMDNDLPVEIYDLMGRRVSEPQKGGIYIVNGKKVVW